MDDQILSRDLAVGAARVPGRVWLAPMTGVTDLPFRQLAVRLGSPYVATEMVACEHFLSSRPDAVRRAAVGEGSPLMVVQLLGADPAAVAAAARVAVRAGARIIDLNFGCPARAVTGLACGSALMRDVDLAIRIVEAAVGAVDVPVTVKMRLGWDEASRNAPDLAARAEAAGARAITVHARTRSQLYGGAADWAAVRAVKAAVAVPVLVNGDIGEVSSARRALEESGADGLMVGRGAIGRPWIAATITAGLAGRPAAEPGPRDRLDLVLGHREASQRFHGASLGGRLFRKHLAAYVEAAPWPIDPAARRAARTALCRMEATRDIAQGLAALWLTPRDERLAA